VAITLIRQNENILPIVRYYHCACQITIMKRELPCEEQFFVLFLAILIGKFMINLSNFIILTGQYKNPHEISVIFLYVNKHSWKLICPIGSTRMHLENSNYPISMIVTHREK